MKEAGLLRKKYFDILIEQEMPILRANFDSEKVADLKSRPTSHVTVM